MADAQMVIFDFRQAELEIELSFAQRIESRGPGGFKQYPASIRRRDHKSNSSGGLVASIANAHIQPDIRRRMFIQIIHWNWRRRILGKRQQIAQQLQFRRRGLRMGRRPIGEHTG